jgi:hypothetical protein
VSGKLLSIERKRLSAQWEAQFGQTQGLIKDRAAVTAASPAPPRPKDHFPDAPKIAPDGDERAAVRRQDSPPLPADSGLKREFRNPAAPGGRTSKAGWRNRRTAAERRAVGSYKPRDRGRNHAFKPDRSPPLPLPSRPLPPSNRPDGVSVNC